MSRLIFPIGMILFIGSIFLGLAGCEGGRSSGGPNDGAFSRGHTNGTGGASANLTADEILSGN